MKKVYIFFTIVILLSCSKDDKTPDVFVPEKVYVFSDIVLTTFSPTLANNGFNVTSGGGSNLNLLFINNIEYGVCYNNSQNPTVLNRTVSANNLGEKEFGVVINNIELGNTFYFRAYARNLQSGEIKYGNEVSLEIPLSLTTSNVKNISASSFTVDVNVGANLASNSARGICYSISQNPTIQNTSISAATQGSGPFSISTNRFNTSSNTIYYIKSFIFINGNYYYGNQLTVKTTGYIGGSGGYVFYDKGEITDGWRYLEAAPSSLTTQNYSYFKWGNSTCGYSFVSGVGNLIGDGKNNSVLIKNYCNYDNIGAVMCKNTSLNARSDWFLPSIDEVKELYRLQDVGVLTFDSNLLSSSQSSNTLGFALNISTGNSYTADKYTSFLAWQVRRF